MIELAHGMQEPLPRGRLVVWFTGLPGAGKSTLALLVGAELVRRGVDPGVLDGDTVRAVAPVALGFTAADRTLNVERLARMAARGAQGGRTVLVAAIAPYHELRARARRIVERHAVFVEVFVTAEIGTCIRRDPKGLYAKALAGEIALFTGVSDPYEPPAAPDLVVDTESQEPGDSAAAVLARLEDIGLVAPLRLTSRSAGSP